MTDYLAILTIKVNRQTPEGLAVYEYSAKTVFTEGQTQDEMLDALYELIKTAHPAEAGTYPPFPRVMFFYVAPNEEMPLVMAGGHR